MFYIIMLSGYAVFKHYVASAILSTLYKIVEVMVQVIDVKIIEYFQEKSYSIQMRVLAGQVAFIGRVTDITGSFSG